MSGKIGFITPLVVKFKKLHPAASTPKQSHPGDAGWDLTAVRVERIGKNRVRVHSGIAVEIPYGYQGELRSRSSIFKKDGEVILSNCVGTIDAGYRGEVMAVFYCSDLCDVPFDIGERFAQLVIMPVPHVVFEESEELSESERGSGGYGSSGA